MTAPPCSKSYATNPTNSKKHHGRMQTPHSGRQKKYCPEKEERARKTVKLIGNLVYRPVSEWAAKEYTKRPDNQSIEGKTESV